jgi:hypothetical protein
LDLTGLGGALLVVYQLAFAVTNVAVLVGGASLVVGSAEPVGPSPSSCAGGRWRRR